MRAGTEQKVSSIPPQTPGEGRGLAPGGHQASIWGRSGPGFGFSLLYSCSSCCTPISVQKEGGRLELQEAITVETHLLLLVCCYLFLQL